MPYENAGIQAHVVSIACQDTDKLPALFGGYKDQIYQARGCLIGDVWGKDPLWEHILDGIRTVSPDLTSPDAHRLVSGAIFIRRMSKADWCKLLGVTQQIPGGVSITWRRPHSSDGAFAPLKVTKRLEVRGVPFGFCTWPHLRKIVCEGLQTGDPNCVCLDIEVEGDKEVPNIILTEV